jgi:hypothetical protein
MKPQNRFRGIDFEGLQIRALVVNASFYIGDKVPTVKTKLSEVMFSFIQEHHRRLLCGHWYVRHTLSPDWKGDKSQTPCAIYLWTDVDGNL